MRAGCKIARRADSYNLFSFFSNQVTEDEVEVGTRAKLLIRQVKEELVSLLDRLKAKSQLL